MSPDPVLQEGWYLGVESWSFHRQFFARCGRPAEPREYSDILWQIRLGKAEPVWPYHYRVTLRDGRTFVVRGGRQVLMGVMAPDWAPPVAKRASTLTLGGGNRAAAAKVLNTHLQRIGIPAREVIRKSQPRVGSGAGASKVMQPSGSIPGTSSPKINPRLIPSQPGAERHQLHENIMGITGEKVQRRYSSRS